MTIPFGVFEERLLQKSVYYRGVTIWSEILSDRAYVMFGCDVLFKLSCVVL